MTWKKSDRNLEESPLPAAPTRKCEHEQAPTGEYNAVCHGRLANIHSSESGSLKSKKHPLIDDNTIIKTKAEPEEGEPYFYATEEILDRFLEPFDIVWMNRTNNLYHNGKKNGSWDSYVLAKKK